MMPANGHQNLEDNIKYYLRTWKAANFQLINLLWHNNFNCNSEHNFIYHLGLAESQCQIHIQTHCFHGMVDITSFCVLFSVLVPVKCILFNFFYLVISLPSPSLLALSWQFTLHLFLFRFVLKSCVDIYAMILKRSAPLRWVIHFLFPISSEDRFWGVGFDTPSKCCHLFTFFQNYSVNFLHFRYLPLCYEKGLEVLIRLTLTLININVCLKYAFQIP